MKSFIKEVSGNFYLILLFYATSLIIATDLYAFFEKVPMKEAFYWACVTSLTVGYGDLSPKTEEGRIMMIVMGHIWVFFFIPLVVTNILQNVSDDTKMDEILELLKERK